MRWQDVDIDDLIGAVKYNSRWHFFAGVLAEWVMDYGKYDPSFSPSEEDNIFRNNLLVIDENNAYEFCDAMAPYELSSTQVEELIKNEGANHFPVYILIDFDKKRYINGFSEISLEDYVPSGWNAYEGDPMKYLPENLRTLWLSEASSG